ncbi:MAG: AbrB/MazE/SpoVT family DNA-binding domain-containing protein [Candidatus Omnitrophica bacterium]|nr:AbrB/MazE/SpoVT family DNA-binding domain-containing protein [Candidatus Omnitrophota bacterium]
MSTVTISPKFQVVIPKETRDKLCLKAGQKVEILDYEGRIELVPIRAMKELRGFLRGIDTRVERDRDRA